MSETDTIERLIRHGQEKGTTTDEWIICLLSSIAHSLAIIADQMTRKGEKNEHAQRIS